jgi:hypothetical protein
MLAIVFGVDVVLAIDLAGNAAAGSLFFDGTIENRMFERDTHRDTQ